MFVILVAGVLAASAGCFKSKPGPQQTLLSPSGSSSGTGFIVSPSPVNLGTLSPGQVAEAKLTVRNETARSRSLARIESSCPCVKIGPVVQTLRAGDMESLILIFDASEEPDFRGRLAVNVRGLDDAEMELFSVEVQVCVTERRGESQP